jgi:hypothetical protein
VEELKQQIRILQAVGYNTVELDEGGGSGSAAQREGGASGGAGSTGSSGASGRPSGGAGGSLEAMLLSKNRHLEHELTMARLKVVDSAQERDAALGQVRGPAAVCGAAERAAGALAGVLLVRCRRCCWCAAVHGADWHWHRRRLARLPAGGRAGG